MISRGQFESLTKKVASIVFLVLCLLGGSLIGGASNLISPESSWVKNTWGYALFFIYSLVPAVIEACLTSSYREKVRACFTLRTCLLLLCTPPLHMTWYWGLYFGAERIIQSHAYVCCTLCSIWALFIGWIFLGVKPVRKEVAGLLLTLSGVALMFIDPSAVRVDGKVGDMSVYLTCIACSLSGTLFFMINASLAKRFPIMLLCCL